jgi:acyl-coenzyme A synthetase/AMP-(fatty) acid ligase
MNQEVSMDATERTSSEGAMGEAVHALLADMASRSGAENHADWMLFRHCREGRGSDAALHFKGETYTYRQVACAATSCKDWLRSLGVGEGQAVLLALPDCPTLAAAYFGVVCAGAIAIIVNPGLQLEDIFHIAQLSRAVVAIVDREVHGRVLPLQHLDGMRVVRAADESWRETSELFEGCPVGDAHDLVAAGARDDDAYGLLTSGSTGRPKLIVHRHVDILYGYLGFARAILNLDQADRVACAAKMSTGYGLGSSLLMPMLAGASAALVSEPPGQALLDAIEDYRCTLLLGQPRFIAEATSAAEPHRHLRSLRLAVTGGEPLGTGLQLRWAELCDAELLDSYGNTEVGFLYVTNRPGAVRERSVGQPIAGLEVELVDERGQEVAIGELGRLRVRGPSVIRCYRGMPEASRRSFDQGWFVTSDVFSRDADGYLYVHGRADHFIKLGCGDWVNPAEIEMALLGHPEVDECAVTGTPDSAGLTVLKAMVVANVPSDGRVALAADLGRLIQKRWPGERFKHLDHIEFAVALPRTPAGKLDRAKLNPQSMTEFSYRC